MVHRYLDFIHSSQSKFLKKFTSNNFYYSLKFARYNVNDEFKYHVDELSHNDSERVISSITYLNDDFSDGETEIMGEIIKPKKNYSLIFPSNWAFLHRGLKVREGIKRLLKPGGEFYFADVYSERRVPKELQKALFFIITKLV